MHFAASSPMTALALATFILIPGLPACCGLDRLAGRRAEHSPARHGPSAMQDDQLGSTFTDRRIFIIMHLSPPPAWLARFLPHSASSAKLVAQGHYRRRRAGRCVGATLRPSTASGSGANASRLQRPGVDRCACQDVVGHVVVEVFCIDIRRRKDQLGNDAFSSASRHRNDSAP
jgi:hypothetical protein